MKDLQKLSIKDFTYCLPEDKIAKYPLAERDTSRLLIYKKDDITEDIYRNIASYIPADSLLIFNDSKVIEARLLFQKPSGGVVEIFCLEPHEQYKDITTATMQQGNALWQCLIGGASKWKSGQLLEKKIQTAGIEYILKAKYIEKRSDCFIIELAWQPPSLSFAEILHHAGAIPLPPYIKRSAELSDAERYQTVYAHYEGSVAAPTAGLHFTQKVLESLKKKGVETGFVTLHVGAGTFKPVKAESLHDHEMHSEWMDVSIGTIEQLISNLNKNIVAAGTTSLRTIESLYWLGVRVGNGESAMGNALPEIDQWEPYEQNKQDVPVKAALQSLLQWMNENKKDRLIAKTKIIIVPGYKPKIAKALITNFHQPQSTLLVLIAALMGNDLSAAEAGWKKIYDYALANNFRFLSYGDGSLLWID